MKLVPMLLLLLGTLLILSGLVFTLQGMGMVGPQASIMFENPAWIYQGVTVAVIGIVVVVLGLFLSRRKKAQA
jgi:hypothetical protein